MSGFHKNAGNVAAEMHGVLTDTFPTAADRLAYSVTASDVSQRRHFAQADTGEEFYPITTGVSATWVKTIDERDPSYGSSVLRFYGDASDGDLLITSSDVTLSTEKHYNTIAWAVGATGRLLIPANAVAAPALKCRTLDLTNCPVGGIQCNALAGGNASGTVGGTAGTTRTLVDGTQVGAGTAGQVGGTSTATTGTAGIVGGALPFGNGGSGGSSGAGGAGSSGAGGVARAGGAVTLPRRFRTAVTPEELVGGVAGTTGSARQIQGGAGGGSGGGGGGDGAASGAGGGSGAGAPAIALYARNWIFAATTPASAIQCKGGNGGNGTGPGAGNKGGGSGGGGGGGGYIYACGDNFSGTGLAANTFDASGGNGGAGAVGIGTGVNGGGGNGGNGGNIDIIQRGVGRIAQATGTTGGVASGTTGGTGEVVRVGV